MEVPNVLRNLLKPKSVDIETGRKSKAYYAAIMDVYDLKNAI